MRKVYIYDTSMITSSIAGLKLELYENECDVRSLSDYSAVLDRAYHYIILSVLANTYYFEDWGNYLSLKAEFEGLRYGVDDHTFRRVYHEIEKTIYRDIPIPPNVSSGSTLFQRNTFVIRTGY